MSLAAAVPLLAQSRYVGVVSDLNVDAAQKRRELLADICDAPSEVYAHVDDSVLKDRAGNTDAHAFKVNELEIIFRDLLCN